MENKEKVDSEIKKSTFEKEVGTKINVINLLYKYELFNTPIDLKEVFESGDLDKREYMIVEWISKNYNKLKNLIKKYIVDTWTWERLSPLERSILLFGATELALSKKEKPLIISNLIDITKIIHPNDSYKYINKILDKIKEEYEKRN